MSDRATNKPAGNNCNISPHEKRIAPRPTCTQNNSLHACCLASSAACAISCPKFDILTLESGHEFDAPSPGIGIPHPRTFCHLCENQESFPGAFGRTYDSTKETLPPLGAAALFRGALSQDSRLAVDPSTPPPPLPKQEAVGLRELHACASATNAENV